VAGVLISIKTREEADPGSERRVQRLDQAQGAGVAEQMD
jgi:hypothetical protein